VCTHETLSYICTFRLEPGECIQPNRMECEVVTATVESVVTTTIVIGEKQ